MERGTMEYISRRTERRRRNNDSDERYDRHNEMDDRYDRRGEENEYPEYEMGSISRRYASESYPMENHYGSEQKEKRQIGFTSEHKEKPKDILYEMEECLENEIDDVVYYSEMAMEAEMKGHREFSSAFYELAKERLACAEFVRLRLIQHGEYDPHKQKDIEERYDRAKHLFKRL